MKREPGFYWVKLNGEWIIAEYGYSIPVWFIAGNNEPYYDSIFDEINETRLIPPD